MGVDLTLCPDRYHGDALGWFLAHTRLDTNRHYAFYAAIQALDSQPLPPHVRFQWYGDNGLEDRQADPYGAPLTWLDAGAFQQIPGRVRAMLSPWNNAVLLFLETIPPQSKVVLWWH